MEVEGREKLICGKYTVLNKCDAPNGVVGNFKRAWWKSSCLSWSFARWDLLVRSKNLHMPRALVAVYGET